LLNQAIDAYRRGFEADWRDHYPGVNAVTLMELRDPPDPARLELLPVVRYAVSRRLALPTANYWDHATMLELSVIANDQAAVSDLLGKALIAMREKFEGDTTANNLELIIQTRKGRGEETEWIAELVKELRA